LTLPHLAETQAVGYVLVLCRVGGLFALAPIFSGRMIPVQAKLIAAGAFSFALMPLVTAGQTVPTGLGIVPVALKEIVVGLAFALALGTVGAAVSAGAQIIDTLVGFSFASVLDPVNQTQSAIIGQLYSLVATLVFLLIGGDRLMIEGLTASYRLLPLGTMPGLDRLAALAVGNLGQVLLIGLEIAAPVLVALVLVDVGLALVARAVPQMNVFFVGLPGKILVGFGAIGASLPFLTGHLRSDLEQAVYQALLAFKVH
jgi:flagellar biosynthetic protein FliR